ncbi:N-acetyltransferase [Paenibacillus sp. J22TS3]|uniref:GNAT family N-acetyltransferase n=1 Tax=Paenibacillus sp. J22TS3 TaxID=2807192 RepID=UPI001B0D13DC|nr:GNAT family N-acetyltransferase [Paenibacillus sp. J22TS3]GIP23519.1 hypothetical protein J22TS3_37940 [Paenibacillus sp. J22TS3]
MSWEIRGFQADDMGMLGQLYHTVTTHSDAVFWWVGEESNWDNVICAVEDGLMIAKGQVGIISVVPSDFGGESNHSIYVNIKTLPDRQEDYVLLDAIYTKLYQRALELKSTLPPEHGTHICVGNYDAETANLKFFEEYKGFEPLTRLYLMGCNLQEPSASAPADLAEGFAFFSLSKLENGEEEEYLRVESEIWPDAPLRAERLAEVMKYPLWTMLNVRQQGELAGSVMVWQDGDNGRIEDVFVREPWRHQGVARFLLNQAVQYLREHGLGYAELDVLTMNEPALSLYESVGFRVVKEEIRLYRDLL